MEFVSPSGPECKGVALNTVKAAVGNRRARSCDIVSHLINSLKTENRSSLPVVLAGACACARCR